MMRCHDSRRYEVQKSVIIWHFVLQLKPPMLGERKIIGCFDFGQPSALLNGRLGHEKGDRRTARKRVATRRRRQTARQRRRRWRSQRPTPSSTSPSILTFRTPGWRQLATPGKRQRNFPRRTRRLRRCSSPRFPRPAFQGRPRERAPGARRPT